MGRFATLDQFQSHIPNEIPHPHVKGISHNLQRPQRDALAARFQSVEVCSVQARKFGELILRETAFFAEIPNLLTDHGLNILQ